MRDGRPGAQEDRRVEHIVNKQAVQKGTYTMIIEVSANAMFGVGMHNLRYQVPDVRSRSELPDRKQPANSSGFQDVPARFS